MRAFKWYLGGWLGLSFDPKPANLPSAVENGGKLRRNTMLADKGWRRRMTVDLMREAAQSKDKVMTRRRERRRTTCTTLAMVRDKSQVGPCRVRPVRWQIKVCQTTEPRTFDSGFSGKVILSTLSLWCTYVPTRTSQGVPYLWQHPLMDISKWWLSI